MFYPIKKGDKNLQLKYNVDKLCKTHNVSECAIKYKIYRGQEMLLKRETRKQHIIQIILERIKREKKPVQYV